MHLRKNRVRCPHERRNPEVKTTKAASAAHVNSPLVLSEFLAALQLRSSPIGSLCGPPPALFPAASSRAISPFLRARAARRRAVCAGSGWFFARSQLPRASLERRSSGGGGSVFGQLAAAALSVSRRGTDGTKREHSRARAAAQKHRAEKARQLIDQLAAVGSLTPAPILLSALRAGGGAARAVAAPPRAVWAEAGWRAPLPLSDCDSARALAPGL